MKAWLLLSARALPAGLPVAVAVVFAAALLVGAPAAYAANTLYVDAANGADSSTCGAHATPCATINQAVANASAGDAIKVAAGTYDETVNEPFGRVGVYVDKSLTLEGAQAGNAASAARAASPGSESVVSGGNVFIAASNVTVDGFSFSYAGNQACVACAPAVAGSASDVTITDNVFSGYEPDNFGPYQVTAALGVNDAANTQITRNYFTSPDHADVGAVQFFNGACQGTVISNNTFYAAANDGLGDIFMWCDAAGPAGSVVAVSGNHDTHVGDTNGEDFAVFTYMVGEVDVTGNTVAMSSSSGTGIYFSRAYAMGAVNISGNAVHGSPYRAVKITTNAHASGPFTITDNDFSGNGAGVYFGANSLAAGASVVLHANDLAGDSVNGGVYNDPSSGGTIDAIDNWWGCNSGPGTPGCSAVSTGVAFDPWLVLGISAAPTVLLAGSSSTVTADVTHDSAGLDTSASGTILDGTTIGFATDFGTLSAPSAPTSGGKASVTLNSSVAGTANVSAALDSQTVSTTVTFKPNTPTSADQCKKGGWQSFGIFKNQGDCVSYVATHGKNPPNGH